MESVYDVICVPSGKTSKTLVIDQYSGCGSTDTVAVMPNIVGVMSGIVVFSGKQ